MVSAGMGGSIMSMIGSVSQAYGAYQQGQAAKIAGEGAMQDAEFRATMLEFSAREAERQGGRAKASTQRQAMEERRQGRLAASRALAVAAASGGGVSDPSIVDLISRTEGEAHYRASIALYEGEAEARRLRFEAMMGRGNAALVRSYGSADQSAGENAAASFNMKAIGKLVEGGSSLYAKYGLGGPKGDAALVHGNENAQAIRGV